MNMHHILRSSLFVVLLLAASAPLVADDAKSRPPNVVLILSDDQAWTDYGFMGHPVIKTPRLDKFSKESALFVRGYVPTALCRPSLSTIISGLYAHQHGIVGNDVKIPEYARTRKPRWKRADDADYLAQCEKLISNIDRVPTLPRLLAKKGFVSHQSGKWWEGNFARAGFTAGMTHGDPKRGGRHGDKGLKIGRSGMKPVLDFIDGAGDKPYFVWYAPFMPHTPHNPPKRLLDKYTAPDRPLGIAKYYAMCEWFDETCGELFDHIDKSGQRENTLVAFVADNGWLQRTKNSEVPPGWRQGYLPKSKLSPHERGVRTPIILRWPGKIRPQRDEETLVSSIDLAPTILAACGLPASAEMSGINLLPVCAGSKPSRTAIFGEQCAHDIPDIGDPARSLRYRWIVEDHWKLIINEDGELNRYRVTLQPVAKSPQLYDLRKDPFEEKNVADANPEAVARLKRQLDDWYNPRGK
jgi:uncharacterized sulfatase